MLKLTKRIFLFLALGLLCYNTEASHNLGGELSYRCVGNGRYVFQVVFYKDCTGVSFNQTSVTVEAAGLIGAMAGSCVSGNRITCSRVSFADISPQCKVTTGGPDSIYCSGGPSGTSPRSQRGAASQFVFESCPVDFNGVAPPNVGATYLFYTTNIPCCRNQNGNLGACSSMTLRCNMYRYELNGIPVPPALLCDNSPVFSEPPTSLQVNNPTDTAVFNNNAVDFDLDSLAFAVDFPWSGASTPCAYNRGFSVTNPIPGLIFAGPGQPVDPITGELQFRPLLQNNYVTVIRVESWRCGQKIAEVYRDFQLQVLPIPMNYPRPAAALSQQTRPDVTKPFPDPVTLKPGESYEACYFVGDTVEFEMTAIDLDFFPPQRVKLFYNGLAFSSDGSKTSAQASNCPYPPCAYLESPNLSRTPPKQISGRTGFKLGFGYNGVAAIGAAFTWPTECSNLPDNGCPGGVRVNKYRFVVTAQDDQCPVNGKVQEVIVIELLPKPVLEAPKLKCVDVVDQNNIRLSWTQYIDTVSKESKDSTLAESVSRRINSFEKYLIYRRDLAAASYVFLDSVTDLGTTTYLDATANPYAGFEYTYRIVTVSGCFEQHSPPSNELEYMRMNLSNSLSTAHLSWNEMASPLPTSSTGVYVVEREVHNASGMGIWTVIGTTSNSRYTDTVKVCMDSVNYRVRIYDELGDCWSKSTGAGAVFMDTNYTYPISIKRVTVDTATNNIVIEWNSAPDGDVIKYYPEVRDWNTPTIPPTYLKIDSVNGHGNTSYTDAAQVYNPASRVHWFNVQGIDSCGTESLLENGDHNHMRVTVNVNKCESTIKVEWNNYVGWTQGVEKYELYRSHNGAPDILLYTSIDTQDTIFTDRVSTAGDHFCYTVVAYAKGDPSLVSMSNKNCVIADVLQIPRYLYLRYASVDDMDGSVKLAFLIDTVADLDFFVIDRSAIDQFHYESIDTVSKTSYKVITTMAGDYGQMEYTDMDAKAGNQSYYYRVRSVDVCGTENDVSNFSRTIFLEGKGDLDWHNKLKWTAYGDWFQGPTPSDKSGVEKYELYRNIPVLQNNNYNLHQDAGLNLGYDDNVVGIAGDDGLFCYYVEAIEVTSSYNKFGLIDTARSNILCVQQKPRIFFPTAFRPTSAGVNQTFAPVGAYVMDGTYALNVYNRWGDKVFASIDVDNQWDGTYQNSGQDAPLGMYVYEVSFVGTDGESYQQKGTVLLVR